MRRYFLLALLLLVALAPCPSRAQATAAPQPVIRYHFGDNPAWASPAFDDSAWPVAPNGRWPVPPLRSSGFLWVRMQIPVPPASNTPLALMLHSDSSHPGAAQVYFQGALIGQSGQLPTHPVAVVRPNTSVFAVPTGLVPARTVTVALRIWYRPALEGNPGEDQVSLLLGPAPLLQAQQRASRLSDILATLPFLSLNALLALLGVGLFLLWYWSRRRELFWFSLLLISFPLAELPGNLHLFLSQPEPDWLGSGLRVLTNCFSMLVTVEFLRTIFNLRARWLRIFLHLAWIVFNATLLIDAVGFTFTAASSFLIACVHVGFVALLVFNLVTFLIDIRYLIFGPNRAIAFGMALIPLGSATTRLGIYLHLFNISLFSIGFFLAAFGISALLVQQAIAAWRQGDHRRIEFAAAREIQQQLVPVDIPTIPGCRIAAAYLPAAEVGGDFYQILPQPDGSTLIAVGDVSGKGLKAAMTGTLAIGALRTIASEHRSPATILQKLNQQIFHAQQAGFITCLCAYITPNGTLTVANAGHLQPYRNGDEIELDSSLPLGITDAAEYTQTTLQLQPGDTLTFMSDGVIEARNPTGELFGFDRTREISTQSAESIAHTAQQFGQEDDITVLTLTLAHTARA